MKKRFMCAVLAGLMLPTLLTGCGTKQSSSANAKKLTIWTNMEVETKALQKMGKQVRTSYF